MVFAVAPKKTIPEPRLHIDAIEATTAPFRPIFNLSLPALPHFPLYALLFRFTVRYPCGRTIITVGDRIRIRPRKGILSVKIPTWSMETTHLSRTDRNSRVPLRACQDQ